MKKKMLLALLLVIVLCVGLMFSAGADAAGEIRIAGHTLALEDSVQVVYYVDESKVPEGATTGLLVWKTAPAADGYTYANAQYKLTSTEKNSDGYKVFRFQKLAAKEMTMDLYAMAYYCKDGAYTYSAPDKYGVLQYAYNQAKTAAWNQYTGSGSITLGEMVTELLDYGFTAQKYFCDEIARPADATYYQVTVEGGTLADGFTKGLFHEGETVNVVAAEEGVDHWYAGEEYLGQVSSFTMPAGDATITAKDSGPSSPAAANWKIEDAGYETLAAALEAAEPFCEIVLQNDVEEQEVETELDGLTIDLNNYTFTLAGGGTLSVPGGTQLENGTIDGSVSVTYKDGAAAINNVTIREKLTVSDSVTAAGCVISQMAVTDGGSFRGVDCSFAYPVAVEGSGSLTLDGNSEIEDLILPDFTGSIVWDCAEKPSVSVSGYEWTNGDEGWKLEKILSLAYSYDNDAEIYIVTGPGDFKDANEITIPDTYDDGENGKHDVTRIGNSAFTCCDYINVVTLPESLKSIGTEAFYGIGITELVLPEGLTDIGENAFGYCEYLERVTLPSALTTIGDNTFNGCASLTEIELPSELETIGLAAFCSTGLESIVIPDSVTSIGGSAFLGCAELTSVDLGIGVETIGEDAFSATGISEITLPNSVTSIGNAAFAGCDSLREVMLNEGLESIPSEAFAFDTSLQSITIPDSVKSIEERAFAECRDLSEVTFPNHQVDIGAGAFEWCRLNDLVIPDGFTSIGDDAFSGANVTFVTLPKTLTHLSGTAFGDDIPEVTFTGTEEEWKDLDKGSEWDDAYVDCIG